MGGGPQPTSSSYFLGGHLAALFLLRQPYRDFVFFVERGSTAAGTGGAALDLAPTRDPPLGDTYGSPVLVHKDPVKHRTRG